MVRIMDYRRQLIEKMLEIWKIVEKEMIKSEYNKKNTRISRKKYFRLGVDVKLSYIRTYIKQITKEYNSEIMEYNKKVKVFKQRDSFFWTEIPLEELMKIKPEKISLLSLYKRDIISLIQQAQREKEISSRNNIGN